MDKFIDFLYKTFILVISIVSGTYFATIHNLNEYQKLVVIGILFLVSTKYIVGIND
jgi:hypothetical protein